MAIAIMLFFLMTGLTTTFLFWGYDYFHFLGYELDETRFEWALLVGVIENIFVTFLHEGVSSFEKWKSTLVETEQLKKAYLQGQLMGLKNQVKPHFLFNSLNTLSSLITEDQQRAEKFLDEMSKVYRYLLRNNDDQLVQLETEIHFIESYYHLLKARYGDGLQLHMEIDALERTKQVPPLTLQILLENILQRNTISKGHPLIVTISVTPNGWLEFRNNTQKKVTNDPDKQETGLTNISSKFRLLCQEDIIVKDMGDHRIVQVPLINQPQTSVA
jgi:LytS/YehU family sensor histidine kinase